MVDDRLRLCDAVFVRALEKHKCDVRSVDERADIVLVERDRLGAVDEEERDFCVRAEKPRGVGEKLGADGGRVAGERVGGDVGFEKRALARVCRPEQQDLELDGLACSL